MFTDGDYRHVSMFSMVTRRSGSRLEREEQTFRHVSLSVTTNKQGKLPIRLTTGHRHLNYEAAWAIPSPLQIGTSTYYFCR